MRVLAIIPARAGSKAIPGKNLRLIGGAPLIAHAIRACRASARITHTLVSTEAEEVAVVAQRYGADVLLRPPHLAEDHVPLMPVVYHVLETLEARGERFDVVATVQPTSPLIKSASLDRGLALFERPEVETVLSVYDNTHLSWTVEAGRPRPLYAERVNRQQLPPTYTETGGLIASRRTTITPHERIGEHVELLVLDPEEAIDIDTYHDWWLAEKIINRKRIVFNVIGSRLTGLGHVHRVLTLARRMSDHQLLFVMPGEDALAREMIEGHHFAAQTYDGDPLAVLDALHPDIVVNDVLDTDAELVDAMKQRGWRVVNFEDSGSGAARADVVINALYHGAPEAAHVFNGADYYCLREEFFSVRRRETPERVRRVMVCFGGTDPSGLTVKTLRALGQCAAEFELAVVLGPGFADQGALDAALAETPRSTEVVRDTKVISAQMEQADLLVTSAGRTIYEAATVGVPALVLCQNERELKHAFAAEAHGFVNLGLGADVSDEHLVAELSGLIDDYPRRRELQRRMWEWDGRAGIERVMRLIVGDTSE